MKFNLNVNKWLNSSIVTRLTALYAVALIVSSTFVCVILYWGLTRALRHELNLMMRDRFEAVTHTITLPDGLVRLSTRAAVEWAHRSELTYLKIEDLSEQKVVAIAPDENGFRAEDYFVDLPLISDLRGPRGREFLVANQMYFGAAKVLTATGPEKHDYRVSVVISSRRENQILEQYRFSAAGTLLVMTLISVLFGGRLAKFSFRPLDKIIETTKNIQASRLSERIDVKNMPIEIANLASTLNSALDRLEESFERLARFSSGIAHELRTPMSNIMVQVEVALNSNRKVEEYKDVMVSVIEESQRLTKMIDKLLLLARIEYPEQSLQLEYMNVLPEVHNLVDFYIAMAEEQNLKISFSVTPDLQLCCDRGLFQRALSNLLTNAINYTPPNGQISVRAFRNGSQTWVSVTDTGIGIPKHDLERVFDRFYRVDPSRQSAKIGGFGLGLSIVQSVMRLHGGEVRIESEEGKGTTVTLIFLESPRPAADRFTQV